jgi:hypothetical protein
VDPVPNPLRLRKSGSAGNRARTSGSAAENSDHQLAQIKCLSKGTIAREFTSGPKATCVRAALMPWHGMSHDPSEGVGATLFAYRHRGTKAAEESIAGLRYSGELAGLCSSPRHCSSECPAPGDV